MSNYVDSLIASGCSVTSLEHFAAQRRAALKRRVDRALTASAQDDADTMGPVAEAMAAELQIVMTTFLRGADHTEEEWRTVVARCVTTPLAHDLEEWSKNAFLTRSLPVAEDADIEAAIITAVNGSDQIRLGLLQAWLKGPEAVAAALSLPQVIQAARSLTTRAREALEAVLVGRAAATGPEPGTP